MTRRPRCILFFAILLATSALPPTAWASDDPNAAFVELGGSQDPRVAGVHGGFALYREHTAVMAGLSVLGSSTLDDLFTGINLGVRLHPISPFRSPVTPFIGLGGFAGYAEETTNAEDDDIDNDGDGTIDEPGETKDSVTDVLSAVSPELGIHIRLPEEGLITLAARYTMTTRGREFDHVMVTLGFTFPLDF